MESVARRRAELDEKQSASKEDATSAPVPPSDPSSKKATWQCEVRFMVKHLFLASCIKGSRKWPCTYCHHPSSGTFDARAPILWRGCWIFQGCSAHFGLALGLRSSILKSLSINYTPCDPSFKFRIVTDVAVNLTYQFMHSICGCIRNGYLVRISIAPSCIAAVSATTSWKGAPMFFVAKVLSILDLPTPLTLTWKHFYFFWHKLYKSKFVSTSLASTGL